MTHPCIIAVIIGVFLLITQMPLPGFVDLSLKHLGSANTPLALLLVGSILAGVPLRALPEKKTLYYCFVRLFLIPLLVFLLCYAAKIDAAAAGVSVVLSGMPAASTTAVMAAKYCKDEVFATKCVVLSTLLSMITVPIWCLFIVMFF